MMIARVANGIVVFWFAGLFASFWVGFEFVSLCGVLVCFALLSCWVVYADFGFGVGKGLLLRYVFVFVLVTSAVWVLGF